MPPTRPQLAKIHIAKKELSLTEEVYRDILRLQFSVDSSSKLSRFKAEQLLDIFKAKGWRPKYKKSVKKSPRYDRPKQRMIVGIWITLAQNKVVKNGSDKALQGFVKRMTKRDDLRFCDDFDCDRLIEILKQWAGREGVDLEL